MGKSYIHSKKHKVILKKQRGNMDYITSSPEQTVRLFNTSMDKGLSQIRVQENYKRYGKNILSEKKKQGFFSKVLDALKEPMLIILAFAFIIAFGTKLGSFLKTGEADFSECLGIFLAIILSVAITLIMEGSSERAFSLLNKIYDNVTVKVIRDGETIVVSKEYITVGDIIVLNSGDKIIADGRIIECDDLSVDESALTGESNPSKKQAGAMLSTNLPLAEQKNLLFSGTFVVTGTAKMVVTAIGDNTEIGKIADQLKEKVETLSPLNQKLSKLGKTISLVGGITAFAVFILSVVRLYYSQSLTFEGVQDLFISCIILIVAAVPEGLPAIVAVSLALNMIKLAKENALIKKMIATETAGAVSVICSDKTGTLTKNKMTVTEFCSNEQCASPKTITTDYVLQNFICNNTADILGRGRKAENVGSGTECALITAVEDNCGTSYKVYREKHPVLHREPFTSESKKMITVIKINDGYRALLKGAPEKVLELCNLNLEQKQAIVENMKKHQRKAERVLCFAHKDQKSPISNQFLEGEYIYDGYAVLKDPIRKEVKVAVRECNRAGVSVIMLTGDNITTAAAIAKEIGLIKSEEEAINAGIIDGIDDQNLKKMLKRIKVIARSTPSTKLRIVRCLKEMGEVVAVTGDGINDAPAIKHADVGISMGITGSEISKEAADVILLDDSFSTVVKAIEFGRNVYKNLQRFIFFQLSVNLSALIVITVCALLGIKEPFNTLQLLWINVIMDGPPALTLGLQSADGDIMRHPPVKREKSIVSPTMFFRILFNGVFIGVTVILQYLYNFLRVSEFERTGVVFTLFILFQLFNAFNSRELGSESIFKSVKKNMVMVYTFLAVFLLHFIIVQFLSPLFRVNALELSSWIKCIIMSSSIVIFSEAYKIVYKRLKK